MDAHEEIIQRLKAFLFTVDEYLQMTSAKERHSFSDLLDPYTPEQYQEVKIKLILLRKYTMFESNSDKTIYLKKRLQEIKLLFPQCEKAAKELIEQIDKIETNSMTSCLSDGSKLTLRETIELELYGVQLHSDFEKIEKLLITDPKIRFIAIRKYVETYEDILIKTYKLIKECGVQELTATIDSPRAEVLRVTESDGVGQNVSNPYWANLFGKDASDEEVWALLDNQSEEENVILFLATVFLSLLEDDCPVESLQPFIHPATTKDWGDFQQLQEFVKAFPEMGLSTKVRFNDRHDMAYVYLLENVTDGILIQEYQIVPGITTVNFVKEKNSQRWLIYSIGDKMDDYLVTVEPFKEIKKRITKMAEIMRQSGIFKQ